MSRGVYGRLDPALAFGGLVVVLAALLAGFGAGRLLGTPAVARGRSGRRFAWVGGAPASASVDRAEAETLGGSEKRVRRAKKRSKRLGASGESADSAGGPGD